MGPRFSLRTLVILAIIAPPLLGAISGVWGLDVAIVFCWFALSFGSVSLSVLAGAALAMLMERMFGASK